MLALRRFRTREPGLADLLPFAALIDSGLVLTKEGALIAGWFFRGPDVASPAVISRVGLRKSAIYEKIRREEFPRPVPIGRRARAWRASDIEQWIAQRG